MLGVFRRRRLSRSAAGGTGTNSSSSSWVGCREPNMVSSVMQLQGGKTEKALMTLKWTLKMFLITSEIDFPENYNPTQQH